MKLERVPPDKETSDAMKSTDASERVSEDAVSAFGGGIRGQGDGSGGIDDDGEQEPELPAIGDAELNGVEEVRRCAKPKRRWRDSSDGAHEEPLSWVLEDLALLRETRVDGSCCCQW